MPEPKYFTLSELLQRPSWSRARVRRFLGEPRYKVARIEGIEASKAWRESVRRRGGGNPAASVATKRARALQLAAAVEIELPAITLPELLERAEKSGQPFEEHLRRRVVNYLRHEATGYDLAAVALRGRPGGQEALCLLRARIFDAISEAWPGLREECDRQARERRLRGGE